MYKKKLHIRNRRRKRKHIEHVCRFYQLFFSIFHLHCYSMGGHLLFLLPIFIFICFVPSLFTQIATSVRMCIFFVCLCEKCACIFRKRRGRKNNIHYSIPHLFTIKKLVYTFWLINYNLTEKYLKRSITWAFFTLIHSHTLLYILDIIQIGRFRYNVKYTVPISNVIHALKLKVKRNKNSVSWKLASSNNKKQRTFKICVFYFSVQSKAEKDKQI